MMPGKRPETKAVKTKEKTAAAPTYKTHAPQTLRNRKSSKYQYEGRSRRKRIAEDGTKSLELLRGVCTITKPNKTVIDSTVLRLHSNSTVVLLITFSIAVTTRQYVGNPIDCMEIRGIPEDILNSYCWIHSTYVIIETVKESKQWGHYPGVHYTGKSPVRLTKYYHDGKMLDIFRGLKSLVRVSHIHIDSPIFRLHHSITVSILIAFSLIVTTRQYVGNPIDCIHTKEIPEDVFNTFCWIHSTFTVSTNKQEPYAKMYLPGSPGIRTTHDEKEKKVYRYYQWVCFCLFFQAMLFYAPRWLWKSWEGGKIHALMMDLDVAVCTEIEKKQKKKLMIDYLWENLRYHNWWAYKYYFCEVLALVNVVGQMFLMNRFLTAPS
nr:unnamed protein product [Callosobruchus chinensis]